MALDFSSGSSGAISIRYDETMAIEERMALYKLAGLAKNTEDFLHLIKALGLDKHLEGYKNDPAQLREFRPGGHYWLRYFR